MILKILEVDFNPLDVYDFIKKKYTKPSLKLGWIPYTRLGNFTRITQGKFSIFYQATCKRGHVWDNVAVKCFSNTRDFRNIGWWTKLRILKSISSGLQIVHNADFIHRNLHSGNILMEPDLKNLIQGRIGDFGLSQSVDNVQSDNEIYGMIPYMAPEIFDDASFSKASDIYSFAMVMWECTTDYWYNNYNNFGQAEEKRLELLKLKKLGPLFTKKYPNPIYSSKVLSPLTSRSSSNNANQGYISKEYDIDFRSLSTIYAKSTKDFSNSDAIYTSTPFNVLGSAVISSISSIKRNIDELGIKPQGSRKHIKSDNYLNSETSESKDV
ncbi:7515_t:CDS:2 [Funneliformis geosporum]|uniref:7515_t:CDS:1 n=1 Tax=Funneliformis geosporum TaxID=1117311 RepID=A0A9W4T0W5_9GLOM|nr:7515_t:CDS:2 [Funneliformis geosporum]